MRSTSVALLAIGAAGCAAPASYEEVARRMALEDLVGPYAARCTHLPVAEARAEFVASRPPAERAAADAAFDAWLDRHVANTFGPMPDVAGKRCELHDDPRTVGLEEVQAGLDFVAMPESELIFVTLEFGFTVPPPIDDSQEIRKHLLAPPRDLPWRRRAQRLGCVRTSDYSWTVYCPTCERRRTEWEAGILAKAQPAPMPHRD